jgi:hypothetical protein
MIMIISKSFGNVALLKDLGMAVTIKISFRRKLRGE